MNMPEVTFDGYLLRTLSINDYQDYFEIGRNAEAIKFLTWRAFHKKKEAKHMLQTYLKRAFRNEPIGYAIVDVSSNKMIGIIEFHTFDYLKNQAEVGYLLHQDYWHKGIMSKAVKALLKVGFEHLELDKIIIRSLRENIASLKVIERNDLELISIDKNAHYHEKTKTFHDIFTYIMTKERYYGTKT
ncbi:MAG: GNAT family N-acetyltransferase [Acholeplasmataceae bacterium]